MFAKKPVTRNSRGISIRNEILDAYSAADALVLPSDAEGKHVGLVVNEAMAGGKTALVSDRCRLCRRPGHPSRDWGCVSFSRLERVAAKAEGMGFWRGLPFLQWDREPATHRTIFS